jgi:hypothetical protein
MAQRKRTAARAASPRKPPVLVTDLAAGQIVKRPTGHYWLSPDSGTEVGPYPSYEEALADMELCEGEAPEPGESLQEAESELGIADWIDPDTGGPAEGWSTPHISDD